jgi:membrane-associated PAP2 superfamily phosphatase
MNDTLRRDVALLTVALLALLVWDATGWDLVLAHWYGSADGFAWRDHWFTSRLMHDGGRAASWTVLAAGLWLSRLDLRRKVWWLVTALTCAGAITLLKHFSLTSCPWSLVQFGGTAHFVSHWQWGVIDGGGGHCFPSGHASSAFALLAGAYALDGRPARGWLAAVLAAGVLLGWAQMMRGAHYASHTLWTAWVCWAITAASHHLFASSAPAPQVVMP